MLFLSDKLGIITDEPELVKEEKNILENDYTYYDKILRLINI